MELWIRSQHKGNLCKITSLEIEKIEKGYDIWNYNHNYHSVYLGTYKTEERALEVLDEIENAILGIITDEEVELQNVREYTGTAFASKITNNIVYQMPEE